MSTPLLLRGGTLVDPKAGTVRTGDLFIRNGRIETPPATPPIDTQLVDAKGLTVVPGLIDIHVHLREPGNEQAETIETGCRAAARGGFTTVVAMPNTQPPLDSPKLVAQVIATAEKLGLAQIIPSACITCNRAGERLADLPALRKAGALVFTDDGTAVPSQELMLRAMQTARDLGVPIMEHAQDPDLGRGGVMHDGRFSEHWKLPGIPSASEFRIVERDIALTRQTGCALHIQHVSTRESVDLIREARRKGYPVSGELTPHHLALTEADVQPDNASFKMNPPLRSQADQEALAEAVIEGTLQAFATDHAPHTAAAKARGFLTAPFGIIGLETAVGITYTRLVATRRMSLLTWTQRWTTGPAAILGLPTPSLAPGSPADIALLDLSSNWKVDAATSASKSRNTPFDGCTFTGRSVCTIFGGNVVWSDPGLAGRLAQVAR